MKASAGALETGRGTRPRPARRRAGVDSWIGCSGWFYRGWKGEFYPEELPQARWFTGHYARLFRTAELNATFYRFPAESTVDGWYEKAPDGFRYSLKVPRSITHFRRFHDCGDLIRQFYDLGARLKEKLGVFLFQLPRRYAYSPERLDAMVRALDARWSNAVEFRDPSWWNPDVEAALSRAGAIFCSVSGPGLPDRVVKTAEDIYVRFHGIRDWYRHDYSGRELRDWAARIRGARARRAWIYFNNDVKARAPKNALELARLL